jgi:hypothetical protein
MAIAGPSTASESTASGEYASFGDGGAYEVEVVDYH